MIGELRLVDYRGSVVRNGVPVSRFITSSKPRRDVLMVELPNTGAAKKGVRVAFLYIIYKISYIQ